MRKCCMECPENILQSRNESEFKWNSTVLFLLIQTNWSIIAVDWLDDIFSWMWIVDFDVNQLEFYSEYRKVLTPHKLWISIKWIINFATCTRFSGFSYAFAGWDWAQMQKTISRQIPKALKVFRRLWKHMKMIQFFCHAIRRVSS